jgi:hypothetical protein
MAPSIRKRLALTSLANGGRSVSIVRWRTKATESICFVSIPIILSCVRAVSELCLSKSNQTLSLVLLSCWHCTFSTYISELGYSNMKEK